MARAMADAVSALSKGQPSLRHVLQYCPGETRFAHQLEMLLGAAALCEVLGRSLVLHPLLETVDGAPAHLDLPGSHTDRPARMVPFADIFNATALTAKIDVVGSHEVEKLPRVVPASCPRERVPRRPGVDGVGMGCRTASLASHVCTTFWADLGFELGEDRPYGQLLSLHGRDLPVLTLSRPGPFPVPMNTVNKPLQVLLRWSQAVERRASVLARRLTPRSAPFLGIHLNVGREWASFCFANASAYHPLFEGCAGPGERVSEEACAPHRTTVLQQVRNALERTRACALLVVSDVTGPDNSIFEERLDPTDLEAAGCGGGVDLQYAPRPSGKGSLLMTGALVALMSRSAGFVGYCCSRFSDLIAREREVVQRWPKRSNWRWGFNEPRPRQMKRRSSAHGERSKKKTVGGGGGRGGRREKGRGSDIGSTQRPRQGPGTVSRTPPQSRQSADL